MRTLCLLPSSRGLSVSASGRALSALTAAPQFGALCSQMGAGMFPSRFAFLSLTIVNNITKF